MEKIELVNNENDINLFTFLKKNHISKNYTDKLIRNRQIFLGEKRIKKKLRLKEGDRINIFIEDEENGIGPVDGNLKVLYEDEDLIAVYKRKGICMHSYSHPVNLNNYVSYLFKEKGIRRKVRFINRLDMDTEGIVLVAKNPIVQNYFTSSEADYHKFYLAKLEGDLASLDNIKKGEESTIILYSSYDETRKKQVGSWEEKEAFKKNITRFKLLSSNPDYSIVEVKLETGKTHQIRLAFSQLGYPLEGDTLYESKNSEETFNLVHYKLSFLSYREKKRVEIKIDPWKAFE